MFILFPLTVIMAQSLPPQSRQSWIYIAFASFGGMELGMSSEDMSFSCRQQLSLHSVDLVMVFT